VLIERRSRREVYVVPWFAGIILAQAGAGGLFSLYMLVVGGSDTGVDTLMSLVSGAFGAALLLFAVSLFRRISVRDDVVEVRNLLGARSFRVATCEFELRAKPSRHGTNHSITIRDGVSEPMIGVIPVLSRRGAERAKQKLEALLARSADAQPEPR
jgi:hypothetical protein